MFGSSKRQRTILFDLDHTLRLDQVNPLALPVLKKARKEFSAVGIWSTHEFDKSLMDLQRYGLLQFFDYIIGQERTQSSIYYTQAFLEQSRLVDAKRLDDLSKKGCKKNLSLVGTVENLIMIEDPFTLARPLERVVVVYPYNGSLAGLTGPRPVDKPIASDLMHAYMIAHKHFDDPKNLQWYQ